MKAKRLIPRFCCAALLASVFVTLHASAQGTVGGSQPKRLFSVAHVTQLRKGVDSWPVITGPSSPAVRRANALLNGMNRTLVRELHKCDKEFQQYAHAMDDKPPASTGGWDRKVSVKMRGPRFVSMVADQTQFCGGAYPDNDFFALVFDMTTGGLIDWKTFVSDTEDFEVINRDVDGTASSQLIMPSLSSVVVSRADGECKQALEEENLSFLVWPDAKSGVLMVNPTGLPHVVQACEEPLGLTIDQARKLGFSDALLDSVAQAHGRASHAKQKTF
ncbi:MAG: hypothetical protein WB524_15390 [Acidobacteriaceae bacterium]